MRAFVLGTSIAAIVLFGACTLTTDLDGLSGARDATDASVPPPIVEGGPLPEASPMQDAPVETGTGNAYADLVLSDGPASYYRFEETAGSNAAKDEIGNVTANVDKSGVTFGSDGVVGHAALFAGNGAQLDLGDVYDFAGQVPFTLELWAKPTTTDLGGLLIHKRYEPSSNTADFLGYVLYLETGTPHFEAWGVALTAWNDTPDPTGFVHLVVAVSYVTGKGNATLYINALPAANGGYDNTDNLANTTAHFTIGRTFTGLIDEVAIYAKALTPDRILAHYRAGKP